MTFVDVLWDMIFFFFWFMAIWIFINIFADIFRRNDMSGGSKAIWLIVIFVLPFIGCLIYLVSRPKVTAQDVQMAARADAAVNAASSVSTADELAKLGQLKDSGAISAAEFDSLKAKLLA
jgi:predicted component of type VI protein secretion system